MHLYSWLPTLPPSSTHGNYNWNLNNQFREKEDERNKLVPTQGDRPAFKAAMEGKKPEAGTQISKATSFFAKALDGGDAERKKMDLEKLYNCIVYCLDMVSIHLDLDESPNRIFESLNNTGMRLSVSDLIRNYLLMNIPNPEQQERSYNEYWYPMQQRLVSRHVQNDRERVIDVSDEFFWRYLMMDGSLPRKDDIFDAVRDRMKDGQTPEKTIKELKRYSKFSQYYAYLVQFDSKGLHDSLQRQIRRLNEWEVDVAYPFLMKGLDKVASGVIRHEQLLEVMQMIESFVVRGTVCGVPTNSQRRMFAHMSAQVDGDFVQSSRDYLMQNRWPSDDEFKSRFVLYRLYVPSRLKRTRLVLESLQESFHDKESPKLTDKITIEHVMPQDLTDEWKTVLGANASEIHDQWLHTVGNLTLTGYNSSLSNKPFTEKKELLSESKFALSKSIIKRDEWNATTIEERGCELADRALSIWPRYT